MAVALQKRSAPNPSMFTPFAISFLPRSTWAISLRQCALIPPFLFLSFLVVVVVVSRPMAPQLAPPKIPEGERVDFDVSGRIKVRSC